MVSENFNQFGPTFQSKIISSLLSDNKDDIIFAWNVGPN